MSEVLCITAASCSASYDGTEIVCVVSDNGAAVTKVHCVCDVICCLAVDQEGL